ncbi:expressed unknown protein (Partial), partial [Seminavis robusta]|eukprot:Sro3318_g346690.1 n/a (293) ;mRNA; f:6666-7546
MYLKSVLLTVALASSFAAAHPHPPHPHPNCTVGTDTEACSLPDGGAGMFVCRPHPPHDGKHHGGGGIGGAFLRVVDRFTGHHPPPHSHSEDEAHLGPPHHGHGHGDHHHGGDKEEHHHWGEKEHHHHGPHRQLRSGSSSSSSSSRSGPPGPHHGGRHGHGPHGSSRSGPHHGGRHGHGPHGHGPPDFLSPSHCVPVDGPPKDFPPPPHHDHHHPPAPTCGCCGDVCPVKLDCGCGGCKVQHGRFAGTEGVWVTVTSLRDETTKVRKCVPAGAYVDADSNRVQCVTECSEDMVE